jgi:hypothetical protein
MKAKKMAKRTAKVWVTGVAVAVALVLAAAGCARNVDLGVHPGSDAGVDADAAGGDASAGRDTAD